MKTIEFTDPVTSVPLVGPSYEKLLKKLAITSVKSLLYHYPVKYLDRSEIQRISDLVLDQPQTILAQVVEFKNIYTRTGKNIQQAVLSDESGSIKATWFNQRYLSQAIKEGATYAFSGKPKLYQNKLVLSSPDFELSDGQKESVHSGRLVPVYPETAGVSSKWLRSRLKMLLEQVEIPEYLPDDIVSEYHLISLHQALSQIHFPESRESLAVAQQRLGFDELFQLQLQGAFKRFHWHQQRSPFTIHPQHERVQQFIKELPFTLTGAQERAVSEITTDLMSTTPMNRLLEGDVGSGKTVIAAIASYLMYLNGLKTVVMAPTEILALQHFQEFVKLFNKHSIAIGLATSNRKLTKSWDMMVGTHALLFALEKRDDIGLVIVDEQHRFGVSQRAKLEEFGNTPHRLSMSATPIPRTVALTIYGDLDVSILDEMPKERQKVKTWVVPHTKREGAYQWMEEQMSQHGSQIYVVCPLVDDSDTEMFSGIKSATQEYNRLVPLFPNHRIGLLHGKMSGAQKDEILRNFKEHKLDILVSTPVIEVGINVPNATIMVIEGAERFGLAQLHQLRGRVGRGHKQSYCLLFTTKQNKTENSRLKALTQYNSGFKLAEIDLKLRGPGEVFGTMQHGFDTLKLAKLSDYELVNQTKIAAEKLIQADPTLRKYPKILELLSNEHNPIAAN